MKGTRSFVLAAICFATLLPTAYCYAAGPAIAFYGVGEHAQTVTAFLEQFLETKGYQVAIYQGESTIEKHVEKANTINRSATKVCIAVEMVPADKKHVLVARTEARKGEGQFLTVDEVPERYVRESRVLADSVAKYFGVRAERMPLFPLLGIDMPGIFIELRGSEEDLPDVSQKLYLGLDKYFRKE
jgi:hypothetical protein